jgi:hypothetical protein
MKMSSFSFIGIETQVGNDGTVILRLEPEIRVRITIELLQEADNPNPAFGAVTNKETLPEIDQKESP